MRFYLGQSAYSSQISILTSSCKQSTALLKSHFGDLALVHAFGKVDERRLETLLNRGPQDNAVGRGLSRLTHRVFSPLSFRPEAEANVSTRCYTNTFAIYYCVAHYCVLLLKSILKVCLLCDYRLRLLRLKQCALTQSLLVSRLKLQVVVMMLLSLNLRQYVIGSWAFLVSMYGRLCRQYLDKSISIGLFSLP